MSDEPRLLVGRYRLETVLGSGGMGRVWLARDEVLARPVAVKEVRFPYDLPATERDLLRARILREARLTARLNHRGIVTVYDVVSVEGRPHIVMELIRAPNLAEIIEQNGPLTRSARPGSGCSCWTRWTSRTLPGWCTATSSRAT